CEKTDRSIVRRFAVARKRPPKWQSESAPAWLRFWLWIRRPSSVTSVGTTSIPPPMPILFSMPGPSTMLHAAPTVAGPMSRSRNSAWWTPKTPKLVAAIPWTTTWSGKSSSLVASVSTYPETLIENVRPRVGTGEAGEDVPWIHTLEPSTWRFPWTATEAPAAGRKTMQRAGAAGVQPGERFRVAGRPSIVCPGYVPPATSITWPGRARWYAAFHDAHGLAREHGPAADPFGLTKSAGSGGACVRGGARCPAGTAAVATRTPHTATTRRRSEGKVGG